MTLCPGRSDSGGVTHLDDQEFFWRPAAHLNPVALIVKHLAGNLASRWTDFVAPDGEKVGRNRDGECLLREQDTWANLLAAWKRAARPSPRPSTVWGNRASTSR